MKFVSVGWVSPDTSAIWFFDLLDLELLISTSCWWGNSTGFIPSTSAALLLRRREKTGNQKAFWLHLFSFLSIFFFQLFVLLSRDILRCFEAFPEPQATVNIIVLKQRASAPQALSKSLSYEGTNLTFHQYMFPSWLGLSVMLQHASSHVPSCFCSFPAHFQVSFRNLCVHLLNFLLIN